MKKIILVLVAMVSLVVISGCYRPNWYRANTTYAELNADSEWCKSQTNIGSARAKMIDQYEECMKDKGYQLKVRDPYSGEPKSTSNQPRRGTDTGWEGSRHDEEKFLSTNNLSTRYYHRSDCKVFLNEVRENARTKLSREQAETRGLEPCPICKP
jgi:hypothetical protein